METEIIKVDDFWPVKKSLASKHGRWKLTLQVLKNSEKSQASRAKLFESEVGKIAVPPHR